MDPYDLIKSLHLIFVTTWFAGLFYHFRILVNQAEAARKPEPDRTILTKQFNTMSTRVWYIITWPSCLLGLAFGLWLAIKMPDILQEPWMHIKLLVVLLFFLLHLYGQRTTKNIRATPLIYKPLLLRLLGEVPTLLMAIIILLVIMKHRFSWMWGTLAVAIMAVILTLVVQGYRKKADTSPLSESTETKNNLPQE